jgi:hypothetical protein
MTVVRAYANLAPLRYLLAAELLVRATAVAMLIALAAHYLLGTTRVWLDGTQGLFFMAWGVNWFFWPNGPVSNPFATRLLGGLLFAAGLMLFTDFALHHLI